MPVSETYTSVARRDLDIDMIASFVIREDAFPDLLKAYPDDPAQGSPLRTGRGLLPSGKQDKRVSNRPA